MRGFLAAVAGLVAVLALAVALPAAWVAASVDDEDGFVTLTRDVVTTQEVQDRAADLLTNRLAQSVGLPSEVAASARTLLERSTDRALTDPLVSDAWEETLRLTHRGLLADLSEQSGRVDVPLDLAPLARLVAEQSDGVVTAPERLVVDLPDGPTAQSLRQIDQSPRTALTAAAVSFAAAVVALLAARCRSVALLLLGFGAAAVAAADTGLARVAGNVAVASSQGTGLETDLLRALVDVGVRSFDGWLVWCALAGGVIVVLGIVGLVVGRRSP